MSDRLDSAFRGRLAIGDERSPVRLGAALVWLLFIVWPLIDAIGRHGTVVARALTISGALAFVAVYVVLVVYWRHGRAVRVPVVLFGVLVALATALTVLDRSDWGFLFTYCAACSALIGPASVAVGGVAACVGLSGGATLLGGGSGGTAIGWVASSAGIGLLMLLMRDLRIRNAELCEARAELARLAVAQERERFARDLHDLLGHSLSVIALKAELAGRLLPFSADRAASEIEELEGVARQALDEVRQAVSGYHQPTLDRELEGARMALSAAGIEVSVDRAGVLDPGIEGVLAWAVREGATNVIRHSSAAHVSLRLLGGPRAAQLEIVDDGVGADVNGRGGSGHGGSGHGGSGHGGSGHGGSGLTGLAERVRAVSGRLEAGPSQDGGFRLAVHLPVVPSHPG